MIPKARMDALLGKLKDAEDKLTKLEADRKKAEDDKLKQQGEFEKLAAQEKARADALDTQLKSEKAIADKYRDDVKAKREEVKKAMGDAWLPSFDAIDSIVDLDKLLTTFTTKRPQVSTTTPAKPELKDIRTMPAKDFNEMTERAKRGEFLKQ